MNAKTTKRLVYTMGRVGTSSINKALNDAGQPAFSVHWAQYPKNPPAEYPASNTELVNRIKHGGPSGKPLSVIIPIREPMARNIAAFFRTLIGKKENGYHEFDLEKLQKTSTTELQTLFMENYHINYPDDWFRLEPIDMFGYNFYDEEFPHDIGYKIYNAGIHRILIIRLENCNDKLPQALYELLGKKGIHMPHVNEYQGGGNNRFGEYGVKRYKQFKKTPFPREFVERIYNLEMAQHFWSDKEREALMKRWTQPTK